MSSEAIIDISSLLEPVSDDSPVGEDIRENSSPSSAYYTIKDARNSARAAERNSMFDGHPVSVPVSVASFFRPWKWNA